MSRALQSFTLVLGSLLLPPAAGATGVCGVLAPSLDHGAPQLGQELTLSLGGAPAGASVRLFFAPAREDLATPYGLLELDREGLVLLAAGTADALGSWSHVLSIPLDPLLAEVEGHYQALVQDPSAAVAPQLSEAVHLRLLGPRAYTLCSGLKDYGGPSMGVRGKLFVHSVVDGAVAAAIEMGTDDVGQGWNSGLPGPWRPAFGANLARGAALADAHSVVVFDNFQGVPLAKLPTEQASPTLLAGPDGRHVFLLERVDDPLPARVRVLDLETAAFVGTLELPGPSPGHWVAGAVSGQAFVSELDVASGRTRLRRVDLVGLQALDAFDVGDPTSVNFRNLDAWDDWLYASTLDSGAGQPQSGFFTAARSVGPPAPQVATFSSTYVSGFVPVPASDVLLVGSHSSFLPGTGQLSSSRLADPTALAPVQTPPLGEWFTLGPSVVRDEFVWILASACPGCPAPVTKDGEPAVLWRLDTVDGSWRKYPVEWWDAPPVWMAQARSPLVERLLLPRNGDRTSFDPVDPTMLVLDPGTGTAVGSWPLDWGPLETYVLDLP